MSYVKKKSAKQENRTAKEFGGKTTPASGAMWSAKADVRTGGDRTSSFNETDYLIENKYTDSDSYKLERKVWEKIALEALRDNMRIPLMQVDIQDLQLVVMDYNIYIEMFKGYDILGFTNTCSNKSIRLEKLSLQDIVDTAKSKAVIPAISVLFSDKGNNELKLAIVLKEDFLSL